MPQKNMNLLHQAGIVRMIESLKLPDGSASIPDEFKLSARVLVISELHQLGLTVLKIFEILNNLFKVGRSPGLDITGVMDLFVEAKLQCFTLICLGDEIRDLLNRTVQSVEQEMQGRMNRASSDLNEIVRLSAQFSESIAIVSEEVGKEVHYFERAVADLPKPSFQIDGLRRSVRQTVRDISNAMDRLHQMMLFLKRSIASDFNYAEKEL